MNINNVDFLEKRDLREKVIGKVEVLDKVGNLLLLPNTEYGTTEQVANYYKVDIEVIKKIATRNEDELISDGYKNFRKNNVIDLLKGHEVHLENVIGKSVVTLHNEEKIEIPNRGLRLFPKRAILRVGMLLRDSEVAKEIRTRLLDVMHDVEKGVPQIVENVVNEINAEKQLMVDRVEAEMSGDYDKVCEINARLFALKNKRIKELENINEKITTNALTISESRDVINRVVRTIAMKKYNAMFGAAWSDLYSKINYKLGINIRARHKNGSSSLLSTLTEQETFEVEKIVRNWAVKLGLDIDKLTKIA